MKALAMCAAVATALLAAGPVRAATFSEPPDFSGNLNTPSFVGILDIGVNTISGSVLGICTSVDSSPAAECGSFVPDDGDAVSFDIPSGAVLTVATLSITNLFTDGQGTPGVRPRSFSDLDFLGIVGNGTYNVLGSGTPTGTQNYGVAPRLSGGAVDDTVSFDWSLSLTVALPPAAVPSPAALPLMLGGLALLGLVARGRRDAAA